MILFLASVLEQLDLALEHISKGDIHNARFGFMLTDNAVELVLHKIAKDQAYKLRNSYQQEEYPHQAALDKALGRAFDAKVKFAKIEGHLSDRVAQTITILHGYRNEVYHVGLKHETILPSLSVFYFDVICAHLSRYKPYGLFWSSNQKLPERAKKYFHGDAMFPGDFDDFANGCEALRKACNHDPLHTTTALADEMDEVISQQDSCIHLIARGVYKGQETTRDRAVVNTQAWALAFSEEGKAFAFSHGWSGNVLQLVEWLADHYPHKFRCDPIPSWKAQAGRLRSNKNPHVVLSNYQSFMAATANIREALEESAAAAEAEIDRLIDSVRDRRFESGGLGQE
jgi:hypothetical protein